MHAWAAVSHYLDYKAEGDIPDELKKGLNALSGLFYVADDQYEKLYGARLRSKNASKRASLRILLKSDFNLDSFSAYIRKRFPKREQTDLKSVSHLLENLKSFGYDTLKSVDDMVLAGLPAALYFESNVSKSDGIIEMHYYDLAMTRISIYNGDPEFKKFEASLAHIDFAEDKDLSDESVVSF